MMRRILGKRATIGRQDIWLPQEQGWQEELVSVLRAMARAVVDE